MDGCLDLNDNVSANGDRADLAGGEHAPVTTLCTRHFGLNHLCRVKRTMGILYSGRMDVNVQLVDPVN